MTSSARAALLIDADNFNDPDQLRAVHSQFTQRVGKGFVCHAHGAISVWQRAGFKDALADIGGRFMPGLPLDKNTTDANLIIDALMLHFQQGVRRFGIASGDADFAPLAVQLRELGCDVAGYARYAIAFERMVNYFDSVVRFDSPPAIRVVPKVMPASAVAQSSIAESVQAQQNLPPLEPLAKPEMALKAKQELVAPKVDVALPAELMRALKLVPAFQFEKQSLALIVPKLKKAGLIGKGQGAGANWFRQWPELVRLYPKAQPNLVELAPKARLLVSRRQSTLASAQLALSSETAPANNALLQLGEPLMKRAQAVTLPGKLHGMRYALQEVAYLKITPLQVLQATPELAQCLPISLGSVAARLRASGLIQPSHSALRLLKHMERTFEVQSEAYPQWVRYRG